MIHNLPSFVFRSKIFLEGGRGGDVPRHHILLFCKIVYNVAMYYLNSFLPCSIRNMTLASLSRLFKIKIDAFSLLMSFNSHSDVFP